MSSELSFMAGRAVQFLDLDLSARIKFADDCARANDSTGLPADTRRQFNIGLAKALDAGHVIPGAEKALAASAFGKPDQPRDYHGRWGKSGASAKYSTDAEHVASDPDLEKKYQSAINVYTDEFGYTMNAYARDLKDSDYYPDNDDDLTDADEYVGRLTTMFHEAKPLKESITVYRGVRDASTIFGEKVKPGTVLTDKAFMSTTAHGDYATEYATSVGRDATIMNIEVPTGMKALTLSGESGGFSDESSEILLPSNTKLHVVSDKSDDGIRTIHAKVVR